MCMEYTLLARAAVGVGDGAGDERLRRLTRYMPDGCERVPTTVGADACVISTVASLNQEV